MDISQNWNDLFQVIKLTYQCVIYHVSCVTSHKKLVTCHMSKFKCHMSYVKCHMSCVTIHYYSLTFRIKDFEIMFSTPCLLHVTYHVSCVTCNISCVFFSSILKDIFVRAFFLSDFGQDLKILFSQFYWPNLKIHNSKMR